jgi:predicted nucleotidyltransferase
MTDTPAALLTDLPADVAQVLDDFVGAARAAFADRLVSVVLFGSAAEGALRATSDVNVILVLTAFEREPADRLREAARRAQASPRAMGPRSVCRAGAVARGAGRPHQPGVAQPRPAPARGVRRAGPA